MDEVVSSIDILIFKSNFVPIIPEKDSCFSRFPLSESRECEANTKPFKPRWMAIAMIVMTGEGRETTAEVYSESWMYKSSKWSC